MSTIPLIALEEHCITPAVDAAFSAAGGDPIYRMTSQLAQLRDVGAGRVADMDRSNISVQVVSSVPTPHVSAASIRASNTELASLVSRQRGRLAGFAALPMSDPAAAAAELSRCVGSLGFVGAMVDNHTGDGTFYDGPAYDAFWAAAEALGAPVYLHPTWPSEDVARQLYGGGGLEPGGMAEYVLGCGGWGWHAQTGLHVLRLLAAGTFDRFPRLKLVLGHSGEMLPFMYGRVQRTSRAYVTTTGRDFDAVVRENLWVTTSALFDLPALRCLLDTWPLDKVMFSVDYPFSTNEAARNFVDQVQSEGVLRGDDLKAWAYGNAEKLLGIKLAHADSQPETN